ncbi:MAG TPA: hypothetical protein VFU12_20475 [Glycomyces sp.]|nr:hypothetical protein [Glycomyces sp.]
MRRLIKNVAITAGLAVGRRLWRRYRRNRGAKAAGRSATGASDARR